MPEASVGAGECLETYTNTASFNDSGYIQLGESESRAILQIQDGGNFQNGYTEICTPLNPN